MADLTDTSPSLVNDSPVPGNPRRVLVISYPFPPVGGAGVQRVTKFVKFLPRFGWDVSVLTVANPSVPVYDETLQRDIPPETIVRRARSWEPGYALKSSLAGGQAKSRGAMRALKGRLTAWARRAGTFFLQPDPQILWGPGATKVGKRLLQETRHDAIFASGPPFSTFLLAASLSRHARLPLVLDYRDEWTISNDHWENKRLDPVSRSIQGMLQNRVLRAASGVIATTNSSAQALGALYHRAGGKGWVKCIYNGFDPDDFHATSPIANMSGVFRISYVGTLWNLTSVAPLVEAVQRLAARNPNLAARLELTFAGRQTGTQSEVIGRLQGLPCRVVLREYLGHSEAVALMQQSDALCLLLSDLAGAGRVVPAKLFEYLATGNRILTIAPPGESREILSQCRYPGGQFAPGDIDGISNWLAASIEGLPSLEPVSESSNRDEFTRANQAMQLSALLSSL